ncbi:MAG TPA: alpha/beta hydrolase [Acidimicrobiia bacterium]|nr:alpha/beta hydrolase [Acidimicrobiia bacterium]
MTGRALEVDGDLRWVRVEGSGGPVVVFEPGIGDVGLTWGLVQPLVSEITTTFTHDRPGLGGSEPASGPRGVGAMVDDLRSTLSAAALHPPYLLVGHSFASLTVRAFAHRFPEEVSGLLLVDGAHEDQMSRFPPELDPAPMLAGFAVQLRDLATRARSGETIPELTAVPESFTDDLADAYRSATAPTPIRLETVAGEYEALAQSQDEVRGLAARGHGDLPLLVMCHGVPQPVPGVSEEVNRRYEEVWQELQAELAARSTAGEVQVAEGAGHMIHHQRPDLIVAALDRMIQGQGIE